MSKTIIRIIQGAIIPVVLISFWAISAANGWISERLYSSPQQIVQTIDELARQGQLQVHLASSLRRAASGLGIGLLLGLALGVASGFSTVVERAIDPTIQVIRTVPLVVILPVFVVWFGFGELPKVIIIGLSIFPSIYVQTHAGIKSSDKKLLELAKVFHLRRGTVITKIIIPQALPFVFVGLRLAVVTSLMILFFAETLNATDGLGFIANTGIKYLRTDLTFVVVFFYAVFGVLGDTLIRILQRLVLRWR